MTTESYILQMQRKRYEAFKAQNPENSFFDVTFEVDGKLIYANRFFLETISTTFKSMLSERWKSKDEVIKLDSFSYDSFYQFLTFIYSGNCSLTDANVSTMVDMAEFYNVTEFKDFCDEYISKMKYNINIVLDLMKLVTAFSLPKSKDALNSFTHANIPVILQSDKFMSLEKSVIETLLTFRRNRRHEEQLFEAVYKWAENQFISDESPAKRKYVNINEGIKAELSTILPHFIYKRMSPSFFYKFVVPKSFLFTAEEISTMLCEYHKINVTVYDSNRRSLSGSFLDNFNIYDRINYINTQRHTGLSYWFCSKPSVPSDLKKNENVQFYLVIAGCFLQIKKPSEIVESDYLLCEMKGDTNFVCDYNSSISCARSCFAS